MTLIQIALIVAAVYSGGMYLFTAYRVFQWRRAGGTTDISAAQIELETFHLGLCFILSVGFLGVIA